ncbi:hypothetical protein J3R04_004370 [Spirilliplanes yamanashiensis]|nr:hypothetical protein [Spirilliplanes yamanashiensis]
MPGVAVLSPAAATIIAGASSAYPTPPMPITAAAIPATALATLAADIARTSVSVRHPDVHSLPYRHRSQLVQRFAPTSCRGDKIHGVLIAGVIGARHACLIEPDHPSPPHTAVWLQGRGGSDADIGAPSHHLKRPRTFTARLRLRAPPFASGAATRRCPPHCADLAWAAGYNVVPSPLHGLRTLLDGVTLSRPSVGGRRGPDVRVHHRARSTPSSFAGWQLRLTGREAPRGRRQPLDRRPRCRRRSWRHTPTEAKSAAIQPITDARRTGCSSQRPAPPLRLHYVD